MESIGIASGQSELMSECQRDREASIPPTSVRKHGQQADQNDGNAAGPGTHGRSLDAPNKCFFQYTDARRRLGIMACGVSGVGIVNHAPACRTWPLTLLILQWASAPSALVPTPPGRVETPWAEERGPRHARRCCLGRGRHIAIKRHTTDVARHAAHQHAQLWAGWGPTAVFSPPRPGSGT